LRFAEWDVCLVIDVVVNDVPPFRNLLSPGDTVARVFELAMLFVLLLPSIDVTKEGVSEVEEVRNVAYVKYSFPVVEKVRPRPIRFCLRDQTVQTPRSKKSCQGLVQIQVRF